MTEVPPRSDKRLGRTDQALIALDAGTGDQRWRIDNDTPLPKDLTSAGFTRARPNLESWFDPESPGGDAKAAPGPDGGIVALTYAQEPADGATAGWAVVGLNLTDGTTRWAYTAIPRLPLDDPQARPDAKAEVVAVTGSAVVINLEATDGSMPHTTLALDPRTGTELWSVEDLRSVAAVDDSIIAGTVGTVRTVLDARTGKARWSSEMPAYVSAVCDTHAVFLIAGEGYRAVQLNPLTVTEFEAGLPLVCADGLAAWLTDRDLRSRMINTEQTERGATDLDPGSEVHIEVKLEAAAGGYLWGTEWYELSPSEHPDEWVTFALDRTGAKRANLPGRKLLAVSDRYLVAATAAHGDDGHPFEVYRITPGQ